MMILKIELVHISKITSVRFKTDAIHNYVFWHEGKEKHHCRSIKHVVILNIMYDLHNVINLSVDVSHVLVLSYYLVNNKICLKQNKAFRQYPTKIPDYFRWCHCTTL